MSMFVVMSMIVIIIMLIMMRSGLPVFRSRLLVMVGICGSTIFGGFAGFWGRFLQSVSFEQIKPLDVHIDRAIDRSAGGLQNAGDAKLLFVDVPFFRNRVGRLKGV